MEKGSLGLGFAVGEEGINQGQTARHFVQKLAGNSSFSLQLFFYYLERGSHLGQKRTGGGVNSNRPLPSYKNSHSVNEAKYKTFPVKKSFICMKIQNHFHINNFALSLALKKNLGATRKWP